MIRVVLDTNVLVSAHLTLNSKAEKIPSSKHFSLIIYTAYDSVDDVRI
jgi:predicted nucleic acid-binding protein